MSSFDPQFALDVLLPLAEAAYVADEDQLSLPQGFSVVGQIRLDKAKMTAMVAQAAPSPHQATLLAQLQASSNAFGWVVQNTTTQTVAVTFRGTSDLDDWLRDFDFLAVPYTPVAKYGLVHQGFQSVYVSLASSVQSLLQQVRAECKRLIVTGHSLGAALSELAAPDLLHNANISVAPEVYNFAGPRVGQVDFANIFDVQIDVCFRVVNMWDIVPSLPPSLALYEHVGLAVKLDGGFTLDELVAHSLEKSYAPGLQKFIPNPTAQPKALMAIPAAASAFPNQMLVGREA